MGSPELIEK